jgi:hypothetical protein
MQQQLPPFWHKGFTMTADGNVRGDAFLVYLLKEIVVRNGTELNRNHGQRDWRAKFGTSFDGSDVPPDRLFEVVKGANHGYKGSPTAHDMVMQLATAVGADAGAMKQYYNHCRAVQRDLSHLGEEDLDYLDLFGDSKREKLYLEGTRTVACVADCLRLHPKLMEVTWNPHNASRDTEMLFESAAADIVRFNEMLDADGRKRSMNEHSIDDGSRQRYPRHITADVAWIHQH